MKSHQNKHSVRGDFINIWKQLNLHITFEGARIDSIKAILRNFVNAEGF